LVDPWRFWIDRVLTGLIGNGIRLAGSILALMVLFILWKKEPASFAGVRRKVSAIFLCEAIYWLCVLPISLIELFSLGRAQFVELAFIVQILLAGVLLTYLGVKIWNYEEQNKVGTLKLAGIVAIGYLVGIWCNNVFRWFSMAQATSISFILTGVTGIGFLGSIVPLSISLFFAVKSFHSMFSRSNVEQSIKLAGLSIVFLGINYVIYILYSAMTNSLGFVFLVEFWPITVIGLGAGMLRGKI
jgi:hypothetical protein